MTRNELIDRIQKIEDMRLERAKREHNSDGLSYVELSILKDEYNHFIKHINSLEESKLLKLFRADNDYNSPAYREIEIVFYPEYSPKKLDEYRTK